jgi:3-oxoacyl-[acyl-carrier-protein] synthase III
MEINSNRQVKILGIGKYLPSNIISSEKLNEKMCETKGFIQGTTGITERRYIDKETTSYMGSVAVKEALRDAKLSWNDVDCIVSASGVPEQAIPCTASLIQKQLGLESSGIPCFDINSTCLSFLTAFDLLSYLVEAGKYKNVLIVSSEIASVGLNWDDLESSTLFGDGAAAVIIGKTPNNENSKIFISNMNTYSEGSEYAQIKALGTKVLPQEYSESNKEDFLFQMDGKNIFKMASLLVPKFVNKLLFDAALKIEDIDMFIPHQASLPAMNLIIKKLNIKKDKFMSIIHNHGNTIAASIPMTLYEAIKQKKIKRGDKIFLLGTSAGFSVGGMILEY